MAKIKGSEIIDLEGLAAAIGDVKAAYEGLNQDIIKWLPKFNIIVNSPLKKDV